MKMTMKCAALSVAAAVLGTMTTSLSALERAKMLGRVAATQQAGFEIFLPPQHRDELDKLLVEMHTPGSAVYQKWLTPEQFNARFGATPAQIEAIKRQLASYGLKSEISTANHLHVTGSAKAIEDALGTELQTGQFSNGKTKVVAAKTIVPMSAMVEANAIVTGLSGAIRTRTHARPAALPENRTSFKGPYWFTDLKQAYSFPSYLTYTGKGTTIGILISADFRLADMTTYFTHEKLATPSFTSVPVDGGNPYTGVNGDSFETHLDMQQSGGMAPNANILVYVIPDLSDDSIMDGLAKIISDNKTDVVSMSFGGAELYYTAAYNGGTDYTFLLKEEDALFAQGTALGMTFVASSGDSGALFPSIDCLNATAACGATVASANSPAASPSVVGVGGTNLQTRFTSGSLDSTYQSEVAYADALTSDIFYGTKATNNYWGSGGGNSILFAKPSYQSNTNQDEKVFRTVPDISLQMGGCPGGAICQYGDSAVYEYIGGKLYGAIGTSASAPEFAGLMSLAVEKYGKRQGNANYYIYMLADAQKAGTVSGIFNQNIEGYNGVWLTERRYNRVLGNGTVNAVNFLLAPTTPTAGIPQTATNP